MLSFIRVVEVMMSLHNHRVLTKTYDKLGWTRWPDGQSHFLSSLMTRFQSPRAMEKERTNFSKLSSDLRVCTKAYECPHPYQTLITITKKNVLLLKSLYRGRQKQYLLLLLSPNDKLRHNSSKIHSGEPVSLLGFLTEHK